MPCRLRHTPALATVNGDHGWANEATARVHSWLSAEGVWSVIVRVVRAWNEAGLLGVELADELQDLTRKTLREEVPEEEMIDATLATVEWNQLAEHYAHEIVGVGEAELTRRRLVRMRS